MSIVSIQLPPIETDDYVEVDVTVNGKKRHFNYRVEVFQWRDWCRAQEERVEGIKRMVSNYRPGWQLMEIGNPTDEVVPIMFKHVG